MRITAIHAKNIMPIREFGVDGLSDVVVLAGANGVGKTRLLSWLINFLRTIPSDENNWIRVEATYPYEREQWEKAVLDTRDTQDAHKLRASLQRNRKRADQRSTILNFESDRSITQIKPYTFTWEAFDPFDEDMAWDFGLSSLRNRFQDTLHSIFRKVRSRREAISAAAEKMFGEATKQAATEGLDTIPKVEMNPKDYPDPLSPFRDAFFQLLGPKRLLDADIQSQTLRFTDGIEEHPITALSSGEREVVNIVFDFILRSPSDCVVIFDEPELHLHPELSYKLIQTLRSVGNRNQFIFCTHSADIISSSLENSVVFVTPARPDNANQALVVREDDDTHQALKLVGQSIGIVSLGRRIVLVEGDHGSLDKQTYGAILKNRYPNLVLVPSGGKETIESFTDVREKVLDHAMWGVDFFMLCDRDAISTSEKVEIVEGAAKGRLRVLSRYHLENYFLDETVAASVFAQMEPEDSWLRRPEAIREKMIEVAKSFVSYAAALIVASTFRERVGNLDIKPKGVHGRTAAELAELMCDKAGTERMRMGSAVDDSEIRKVVAEVYSSLEDSFDENDSWKLRIPGRPILNTFCGSANMDSGRYKMLYLKAAEEQEQSPFSEIVGIFESFSEYQVAES